MRYDDTRGEGPRVGRRQHAQRPTTFSTREEERGRLAVPRHPLHDLYMGNTALAPRSTPLFLPFPLLSCRETTSATSLQRVRCITFGGFLQGPLGSMRRSSPAMAAGRYRSRAGNTCGCIKSWETVHHFDPYDFNTFRLSLKSEV